MSLASPARSSRRTSPADSRPRGASPWWAGRTSLALAIAAPALLAAALTAYHLSTRSLWLDEAASISIASQHGSALWRAIRHDGGNMLVYYLLLHVLVGWFGTGEAVVRLPSVIASAFTAAFTAGLAWRLVGTRRAVLSAGLLTAVSLPLVYWGQDARGYALMVTLATGALLAFTVIVQSPDRVPRFAVLVYAILTLLSLYVSFYAGLIILVELAVLPFFRRRALLVVGCLVLVALTCIPLAILAKERGSGQLFWVDPITLAIAAKAGVVMISAGFPPNFHITSATIVSAAVSLGLGLGLAAWLGLTWLLRRRSGPAQTPGPAQAPASGTAAQTLGAGSLGAGMLGAGSGWIAAAWLVVPTVVVLAAALAGEPVELARAIILVIPAIAVLFAAGLTHPRVSPIIGLAGLTLLLVTRAVALAPTYHVTPENWQAAASHLAQAARPHDCVLFYPEDGRMPVDYYLQGKPATANLRSVLPAVPWSVLRPYVELYTIPTAARMAQIEHSCPRLWVVASHQGHTPGPAASERDLMRYRALLHGLHHAYRHSSRRQFGYAAPIYVTRFSR